MKNKKYLFLIAPLIAFVAYNIAYSTKVNQFYKNTLSPLSLENIVALSSPEEDDCGSKATRKYTEEKESTETYCAIKGVLDYCVKKVDTYCECDFNPEGSICCDEPTGLISSEVKSETPVKCSHGSAD